MQVDRLDLEIRASAEVQKRKLELQVGCWCCVLTPSLPSCRHCHCHRHQSFIALSGCPQDLEGRLKVMLRDRDEAYAEYARIQEELKEVRQIMQETREECEELQVRFK